MDLIDQLRALAVRITNAKDMIQTEEATKNAMVMPFIQILGYNVFDPLEVTPELTADSGIKKGEKVDYAILKDGKPIILFECKKCGADLHLKHTGQLFRYFNVTEAKFGVLTNGLVYQFFTDLEQTNKMDAKPFFEFNILEFKERDVEELKKFAKSLFDVDTILTTANDLKYTRIIQNLLAGWITNPSEDFVRLISADLLIGKKFTQAIKEQFTILAKKAFEQLLGELINERLKGAMTPESAQNSITIQTTSQADGNDMPISAEEIEGLHIIRSLLHGAVNSRRIGMRTAKSYCAILLDDNNRKSICRLHFNNTEKLAIGLFNDKKEEERFTLNTIDDLYKHAEQLKATLSLLLPTDSVLSAEPMDKMKTVLVSLPRVTVRSNLS